MQSIHLICIDYTICFSDCQEKKGLYFLKETYYDVTVQFVHSNTFLGAHKTHFQRVLALTSLARLYFHAILTSRNRVSEQWQYDNYSPLIKHSLFLIAGSVSGADKVSIYTK